ncbi:MAG TPA: alpha/beta hydrolase [Flavitalea sp.]|nr:alpha/beta hydrolase [Flavitalea sp.]
MNLHAQKVVPLYKGRIPNSIEHADQERSENNGVLIIHKVSRPTLTIYQPPKGTSNGSAILIIPGGGYGIVAAKHEGYDLAERFASVGFTTFVLKYRLPDDSIMTNRASGPLQDAQAGMNYIRQNAKKYGIKKNQVGVMGFSAGGHLAASVGTHYQHPVLPEMSPDNVKPNFMVLVYPVISFSDSIGHRGSRDNLLGAGATKEQIEAYSNELLVNQSTAPTFLVHAKDDDVVPVANSTVFYDQLRKNNVPAEIYLYEKGGHGFGMNNPTSDVKWVEKVIPWINEKMGKN